MTYNQIDKMLMLDRKLTVAVDWDDCYTAAPGLFDALIATMLDLGHTVLICTARRDVPGWCEEVRELTEHLTQRQDNPLHIVFAGRRWKTEAAKEAGFNVDIWMDDMPWLVGPAPPLFHPSKLTEMNYEDWRAWKEENTCRD